MRQSQLFTKTRRESPKDEITKNAQLLIRAGYVHKEMAGIYSYLPLGVRVLNNIERIIREEMNTIGGQEVRMATLHPSEPWKQTGGWDSVDVLFKLTSRTEKEYALGQSEEEIVTPIAAQYVQSYKDLPVAIYQIGQKYRDELRSKSGIMRGREFGMKDMYSFHASQEDFDRFYEIVKAAYFKIYNRCHLKVRATEASGGAFSEKISYEFVVLTDAGEDEVLYCTECDYCVNVEVATLHADDKCPKCGKGTLQKAKAIEAGNVFDLGQKYPKAFDFTYKAEDGTSLYPFVGCYGIGTTRLMGTIIEIFADEKGICWPHDIAPFRVHLVELSNGNEEVKADAAELYRTLKENNIEVLWDDRDNIRAGEKFADSDLMGLPLRVIISEKTLAAGTFECVERMTGKVSTLSMSALLENIKHV